MTGQVDAFEQMYAEHLSDGDDSVEFMARWAPRFPAAPVWALEAFLQCAPPETDDDGIGRWRRIWAEEILGGSDPTYFCPDSATGLHQTSEGSCDLCGAKNMAY